MSRIVALLLACTLAGACSSPGGKGLSGAELESAEVTFRDYRSGIEFTIVNDASLRAKGVEGETFELRRAAFYSENADDTSAKVAEDEVVQGMLDFFAKQGFTKYASDGSAPAPGGPAKISIEQTVGGETRYFARREGQPQSEIESFRECGELFIQIYNWLPQAQSSRSRIEFNSPSRPPGRN